MILGMTGKYTTNMVYDKINLIESNQGIEKAGKILDTILLTEGEPYNWDETPDDPEILGFAPSNTIKMYKLDKDKVRRLIPTSPGYISPVSVRELMGLSAKYYISIRIFPLLNVTLVRTSQENFEVQFVNQWGTSVSNVNVTVAYVNDRLVEDLTEEDLESFLDLELAGIYDSKLTNSLGITRLDLTGVTDNGCMLIYSEQITCRSLFLFNINGNNVSMRDSPHLIHSIESSMGSVSGYNSEVVNRNVRIDGFDYIVRFTLWS
jgi:hypothetical protein